MRRARRAGRERLVITAPVALPYAVFAFTPVRESMPRSHRIVAETPSMLTGSLPGFMYFTLLTLNSLTQPSNMVSHFGTVGSKRSTGLSSGGLLSVTDTLWMRRLVIASFPVMR